MKKISWTAKKTFATAMGILGIGTLTSCYGMPPNQNNSYIEGQVKNGTSAESVVKGIKVTLLDSEGNEMYSTTSDENGFYSFNVLTGGYSVKFEDVDGIEPEYETQEIPAKSSHPGEIVKKDVLLKVKQ